MSRIADVPIYEQRNDEISSKLYNLWRRANIHFTMPMRISLDEHKGLTLILEENDWVCVDETQNDLPVIAWVDFEDKGRDALHMPVKCKLNFYHYAASKLRAPALKQMDITLTASLQNKSK